MTDPLDKTLKELVEQARERDCALLGIIYFDMKKDRLSIACIHGVEPTEVNALLERVGIEAIFE